MRLTQLCWWLESALTWINYRRVRYSTTPKTASPEYLITQLELLQAALDAPFRVVVD